MQAPTAILRFALPHRTLRQWLTGGGFARCDAGDLVGVLPEGSPVPRFYSLASARPNGFIEIVVKKYARGCCSGQLTALEPGDTVTAFLRRNPGFPSGRSRAPLILIGAGTGIGRLAGFVRGNARQRPIHLFYGMRDPRSDFFYDKEISAWKDEGRLVTAVSRGAPPRSVHIVQLIRGGGRVMVCGGRDMAAGVTDALAEILAPTGISPAVLKADAWAKAFMVKGSPECGALVRQSSLGALYIDLEGELLRETRVGWPFETGPNPEPAVDAGTCSRWHADFGIA